ncbi:AI-2E family transporter [Nocardia terpenica]|nr:AI-2E family transporter [Nocardia terpenica]MBF6104291.1 AI-2E family transporter [Nocardia terpenica]MBF6109853.1 AI-2E family transporter [Nocardia terpenica]MBF6120159.1 AI-2E family transporter [Nocardia terpenica]MBF6152570.1 AI-2E family transporter [Nocardia terpenica]
MPRWLPRALLLGFVLLGAYQLTDWAAHRLLGLATMLMVAFFVSLAMEPAVDILAARGIHRALATGVVFVLLFAAVAGFLAALVTLLVETVSNLLRELPGLVNQLVSWVNHAFHQHFTTDQLRDRLLHDSNIINNYAQTAANNVWGLSSTILGGLAQFLTIALFSIYLTADGPKLRRTICSLLPPRRQDRVLHAWDLAIGKTGGYLYSRALLAVISAVAHAVFLAILHLPNALALGVWFGVVASFVPTIGTYFAGVLPVLVALTIRPVDVLWLLIFVVLYQWFQDYLLQPRITARTVNVNAAVALLAVLAGGALLGAVGALLAIPATATVQAFLSEYVPRYEVRPDPRIERTSRRKARREKKTRTARRDDQSRSAGRDDENRNAGRDDESRSAGRDDESQTTHRDDESRSTGRDDESQTTHRDNESQSAGRDDESQTTHRDDKGQSASRDDESQGARSDGGEPMRRDESGPTAHGDDDGQMADRDDGE